ncbi:MAG: hypothetical protein AAF430_09045 [Myxococcota bacterium]
MRFGLGVALFLVGIVAVASESEIAPAASNGTAASNGVAASNGAAAEGVPHELATLLDAKQRTAWRKAYAREVAGDFDSAIAGYEPLARAHPDSAFIAWRMARNHWRSGEMLPLNAKEPRRQAFNRALEWADRSLTAAPECGECVFWKMASMGRLATTVGALESARLAQPMAELIDRGIALEPTYADNDWNHTKANLYLAASSFYRLLPEWFWLEYAIGVRGDKKRALGYIEQAMAITPDRIDYHLEMGAVLLCLASREETHDYAARGRQVLERARTLEHRLTTDAIDQEHAQLLLDQPDTACGYSRDGFMDFSGIKEGQI